MDPRRRAAKSLNDTDISGIANVPTVVLLLRWTLCLSGTSFQNIAVWLVETSSMRQNNTHNPFYLPATAIFHLLNPKVLFTTRHIEACGSVAEWLGRWTCDQQVASSNPGLSAIECNPGQVVNTHVPLSPSSIIWYQPMGGDALRLGR